MSAARPTAINELVPLASRLRYLQLMRLFLAGAVVLYLAAVPEARVAPVLHVGAAVAIYVATVVVGQAVWRVTRARNITLFGALLIGDGFFLSWTSWATGGATSALRHLVVLHLVTVALLASYRTAVKIALWHSLLAVCMLHATRAGFFLTGATALPGTDFEQLAAFLGLAWAAVLTTAGFAAVNERELRRRKVDLEDLARLAKSLEEATAPTDVAERLRAGLVDAYGFPQVVVLAILDAELVAVAGSTTGPAGRSTSVERPDAVVGAAWRTHCTQLVPRLDVHTDAQLAALLGPVSNVLVVPLFAEGNAIGVVVAEHGLRRGSRIERRVATMVERFCEHAALAFRNASLLDELRAMAATDGLTRVANRRAFEDALRRELARSERTGEPTSLVMVDIDHFKALNDRFGHQAGDEVLKAVAAALAKTCRAADLVARYGGEEFAVLLHSAAPASAVETAERLRQAVTEAQVEVDTVVTASLGVATVPYDARDGEALVRVADAALYRAKHGGRNQVVSASEPVLS